MLKYSNTIKEWVKNFIIESNAIENIGIGLRYDRAPNEEEIEEAFRFIGLDSISIEELEQFISIYQPKNSYDGKKTRLRDKKGLNVSVGNYQAPKGCPEIKRKLEDLLDEINGDPISESTNNPFLAHEEYESLHPFTDGNGRTGRIIWLWQMLKLKKNFAPAGFLVTWYYNSLNESRKYGK